MIQRGRRARPSPVSKTALLLGAALLAGVMMLVLRDPRAPAAVWTLRLYAGFSALSFVFYWLDKRAAQWGARRVPERQLHALDLLGGWPGGLLAQEIFRHKTIKAGFQAGFWFTALANAAAMAWWLLGRPQLPL